MVTSLISQTCVSSAQSDPNSAVVSLCLRGPPPSLAANIAEGASEGYSTSAGIARIAQSKSNAEARSAGNRGGRARPVECSGLENRVACGGEYGAFHPGSFCSRQSLIDQSKRPSFDGPQASAVHDCRRRARVARDGFAEPSAERSIKAIRPATPRVLCAPVAQNALLL
jgi:hypothetical protein